MPEQSRLRKLIDEFVIAGRGKVEIDALLTELEQRAETATAMGAYQAGRASAPAIAELVDRNTRLRRGLAVFYGIGVPATIAVRRRTNRALTQKGLVTVHERRVTKAAAEIPADDLLATDFGPASDKRTVGTATAANENTPRNA